MKRVLKLSAAVGAEAAVAIVAGAAEDTAGGAAVAGIVIRYFLLRNKDEPFGSASALADADFRSIN
jgi:hypothetical protein